MSFNKYFQLKKCFIQNYSIKMKKNIRNFYIELTLQILTWKKLKMRGVMWQLLNFIKIQLLMTFLKRLVSTGSKELIGIKKPKIKKISSSIKMDFYHQGLSKDK